MRKVRISTINDFLVIHEATIFEDTKPYTNILELIKPEIK